jgi:hypothetical protein
LLIVAVLMGTDGNDCLGKLMKQAAGNPNVLVDLAMDLKGKLLHKKESKVPKAVPIATAASAAPKKPGTEWMSSSLSFFSDTDRRRQKEDVKSAAPKDVAGVRGGILSKIAECLAILDKESRKYLSPLIDMHRQKNADIARCIELLQDVEKEI